MCPEVAEVSEFGNVLVLTALMGVHCQSDLWKGSEPLPGPSLPWLLLLVNRAELWMPLPSFSGPDLWPGVLQPSTCSMKPPGRLHAPSVITEVR